MADNIKINRIVTWSTKKVDGGFQYRVSSFDHQVENIVHKVGVLKTRARASAQAKRWVRYLNAVLRSQQAKAA